MPWVRLDDQFPNHPKVDKVGPLAAWLHVTALCHASATLTDGFISTERLGRLADVRNAEKLAQALVDAGMWDVVDGGWQIHDYLDYQPSAAKVREQRAAAIERKQRSRDKSRKVSQRDTTVTDTASHTDAAAPPYPIPDTPVSTSSSSPPTSLSPIVDDDRWVSQVAHDNARRKLADETSAGRPKTDVIAWLLTAGAREEARLRELLAQLRAARPGWTQAQLGAALAGDWRAVQTGCAECAGEVVRLDVDGAHRCVACTVPDGVAV